MLKSLLVAAGLTVAALALSSTSAHAQVTINIGRPAPQYVVVREARPVKKYKHKAPKHKYYRPAGPVMLVPAGPAYYAPRGNGHGRGHGKGRH